MEKKSVIIYSSHGVEDPLLQGLMLEYLKGVNVNKEFLFHLFTEEQNDYALSEQDSQKLKLSLKDNGILWYPQQYRNGFGIIFKKAYGLIERISQARKIKKKYGAKMIVGYLAIAGGYAYLISKLLNLQLTVFCFEPHSEYMKDFGVWSEKSPQYRLLNYFEKKQIQKADFLTGPTKYTVQLFNDKGVEGKVYQLPISIDVDQFKPDHVARETYRKKLNIPEEKYALLYLGKFGGIYYSEEDVARFFKRLYDKDNRLFLYVITTSVAEEVKQLFLQKGLPEDSFLVLNKIPYTEIQNYINAADMGMVAVPPLPSQVYRTPVKVGNYLGCGIPFLINKGVGDDDDVAEKRKVGVVFENLDPDDVNFDQHFEELELLMKEDKGMLSKRCVEAAYDVRGMHNSINVLTEIFENA